MYIGDLQSSSTNSHKAHVQRIIFVVVLLCYVMFCSVMLCSVLLWYPYIKVTGCMTAPVVVVVVVLYCLADRNIISMRGCKCKSLHKMDNKFSHSSSSAVVPVVVIVVSYCFVGGNRMRMHQRRVCTIDLSSWAVVFLYISIQSFKFRSAHKMNSRFSYTACS
jgi:hypothetical protein